MPETTRREFLRTAAIGGATVTAAMGAGPFSRRVFAQGSAGNIAYRALGSTGYEVSEVGMGCMNMRDPELVNAAIDSGINYLDTAHSYMNGQNEEVVGSIMKSRRDEVFLTTKARASSLEDYRSQMETSLTRLQTDHADCIVRHGAGSRNDVMDETTVAAFTDAKQRGVTRFIGMSTHSNQAQVLDAMVEAKIWDIAVVGYNVTSPPELKEAIARARAAGIGIVAMKTQNRGQGYANHDMGDITNQQAALRWVLNDSNVDTTIPGMTSFDHLAENIPVMSMAMGFEGSGMFRTANAVNDTYCRGVAGCTGCSGQCPKGVEICDLNRCVGYADGYGDIRLAWENYRALPRSTRADVCDGCDECTVTCAHGLDLTASVRRARELFA